MQLMAISSSLPLSFFFFSIIIFLTIDFRPVRGQCLEEQRSLLLDLKSELIFDSSYSVKLVTWNNETTAADDCCDWEGVECDDGGRVISLQLDDESISGGIEDSTSSLFRLRYLQKVNLADNDFNKKPIPSGIHHLTHLRDLNLSSSGFGGQVPIEVSLLRRLLVLDISGYSFLKVEHPNLKMLIQNLTMLRELYLDDVDLSAGGGRSDWCQAISSSLPHLRILSLSSSGLEGPFHPSLSQLHSLSDLRLDGNDFSTTIPDFFANFSSLTTLSLSGCSLQGVLPNKILEVPTLQELDLFDNELLGGTIPQSSNVSRAFRSIQMSYCSFVGPIPPMLANLTHLIDLRLSHNSLSGSIPPFHMSNKLTTIDLSSNSLTGSIPSFHMSNKLTNIDLSSNNLTGSIPSFHMSNKLTTIDLSSNNLTGSIPSFNMSNKLTGTNLCSNTGSIFSSKIYRSRKHTGINLSYNSLTGSIPSFNMSKKLKSIDLSSNSLTGSLSNLHFEGLSCLAYLLLDDNSLIGSIPHSLFGLPSLQDLKLSYNQFSGEINEFQIVNISNIERIDLSYNSLKGSIPQFLFALPSLQQLTLSNNQFCGQVNHSPILNSSNMHFLDLSSNQLGGTIPHSFFQLQSLRTLDLSDNLFNGLPKRAHHRSVSYNLSVKATLMTIDWDLSNNQIAGDIPSWIWEIGNKKNARLDLSCNLLVDLQKPYHIPTSLSSLDLHSNQLRGELPPLPTEIGYVDYSNNKFDRTIPYNIFRNLTSIRFLSLANNKLSGSIPTSLCNATSLGVLVLSFNKLSNDIPPCLLEVIEHLEVLSLRENNLHGIIPNQFSVNCSLRTLDLSNNNLGGKIPKSVANCKSLSVMNVGNNNFDDNFPCMLPSSLHILVLRSNKFHGEFRCDKSWPKLQILDLSSNNFSGDLLRVNFSSWRGMMLQSDAHLRLNHSGSNFLGAYGYYQDEVTLTIKGSELKLAKIWPDFTSIDFSYNNFKGEIPEEIGNLSSLYHLNLSHNDLTSSIPKSLGALMDLESLDLSANRLRGRIPEELAHLTFLSFLNLSHNDLVGMIPNGPQFQTFSADSFEGNTGLCGFPLNISCRSIDGISSSPQNGKDEEIEWEYVFAAAGYGVGLGSIVWILLFCRSIRERYFEKIEEIAEMIFDHRDRRRRQGRRKRRVVRRNEVRRQ